MHAMMKTLSLHSRTKGWISVGKSGRFVEKEHNQEGGLSTSALQTIRAWQDSW
jgi:hypothetical protein